MEPSQTTESATPTPEQLLKLLDFEFERERARRATRTPRNRASFLAVGIVVILLVAGIALIFAEHLLTEVREQAQSPVTVTKME